ncbi:unnamed protein product [Prunus armeniaca]
MGIKRTSTLSSTSLTSQPLPTAVWIAGTSKKLTGFYPKSPSLVRAIPSTILLRSMYGFSTSRVVLPASCVG